jgi:hypothetical protein
MGKEVSVSLNVVPTQMIHEYFAGMARTGRFTKMLSLQDDPLCLLSTYKAVSMNS